MVASVEDAWVYECSVYHLTPEMSGTSQSGYSGELIFGKESDRTYRDIVGKVYEIDFSDMMTEAGVLEEIAKLEEKYKAQQNITVEEPAVSEEAAEFIDADKITMVGAALNAAAGDEVKLNVSIPTTLEKLDSRYANPVQLDIEFSVVERA